MQTTQRAAGFGEELKGVTALIGFGLVTFIAFALSPTATVVAAMLGLVAAWDASSHESRHFRRRVVTVRRVAYGLAMVGVGVLFFTV